MPEITTPSDEDSGTQENWEQRYQGLQKVIAKRDDELRTRTAELDALRADKEAADTELATFRQRDVDANEEQLARQQYEALKERFEEPPPKPIGNNPARRPWEEGSGKPWGDRERSGTDMGFPI